MITITEIMQILKRYDVPEWVTDGFGRHLQLRPLLEQLHKQAYDYGYDEGREQAKWDA